MIPRGCKICKINKKMWITVGGLYENEYTSNIFLIYYSKKKNLVTVGLAMCQGQINPRIHHAIVEINGKVMYMVANMKDQY